MNAERAWSTCSCQLTSDGGALASPSLSWNLKSTNRQPVSTSSKIMAFRLTLSSTDACSSRLAWPFATSRSVGPATWGGGPADTFAMCTKGLGGRVRASRFARPCSVEAVSAPVTLVSPIALGGWRRRFEAFWTGESTFTFLICTAHSRARRREARCRASRDAGCDEGDGWNGSNSASCTRAHTSPRSRAAREHAAASLPNPPPSLQPSPTP
mmetsp:Transcript_19058/g.44477  ORF Transcript_19058/g.44477 Transcript_19058/m.44477 type:complete len:212 (-) Transcript_19058:431-1066(-)